MVVFAAESTAVLKLYHLRSMSSVASRRENLLLISNAYCCFTSGILSFPRSSDICFHDFDSPLNFTSSSLSEESDHSSSLSEESDHYHNLHLGKHVHLDRHLLLMQI